MTALLLVAHEPLATAWRALCSHVYPEAADQLAAVDIGPALDADAARLAVHEALAALPDDASVLILCDVAGATPCNAALAVAQASKRAVCVVAASSVPMIWRALCYRHLPLDEVAGKVLAVGHEALAVLSEPQKVV